MKWYDRVLYIVFIFIVGFFGLSYKNATDTLIKNLENTIEFQKNMISLRPIQYLMTVKNYLEWENAKLTKELKSDAQKMEHDEGPKLIEKRINNNTKMISDIDTTLDKFKEWKFELLLDNEIPPIKDLNWNVDIKNLNEWKNDFKK